MPPSRVFFHNPYIPGSPVLHKTRRRTFPLPCSLCERWKFDNPHRFDSSPKVLPEAGVVLLTSIDVILESASMGHIEALALRIQTAPCNKSPTFRKWKQMTGCFVTVSSFNPLPPSPHIISQKIKAPSLIYRVRFFFSYPSILDIRLNIFEHQYFL